MINYPLYKSDIYFQWRWEKCCYFRQRHCVIVKFCFVILARLSILPPNINPHGRFRVRLDIVIWHSIMFMHKSAITLHSVQCIHCMLPTCTQTQLRHLMLTIVIKKDLEQAFTDRERDAGY